MTVAAAEAGVGLAIFIALYRATTPHPRRRGTTRSDG
jgi:NADH:ubiquinone oxidoreductase subunit K